MLIEASKEKLQVMNESNTIDQKTQNLDVKLDVKPIDKTAGNDLMDEIAALVE